MSPDSLSAGQPRADARRWWALTCGFITAEQNREVTAVAPPAGADPADAGIPQAAGAE